VGPSLTTFGLGAAQGWLLRSQRGWVRAAVTPQPVGGLEEFISHRHLGVSQLPRVVAVAHQPVPARQAWRGHRHPGLAAGRPADNRSPVSVPAVILFG